jgi:hypothetical protein
MSEPMQRRLIMLFCLRCSNVLETLHEDEIIFALGITPEEWEATKQLFVSKCFIRFISGKCNITNWNKRQFVSDSSTDRVRKYRAKNETLQKRCESVTVTPPDTDSDTDTEQKRKEILIHAEPLIPETPKLPESNLSGTGRIEEARALWNSLAPGIGPACRLLSISFRPDDASDCLRTMSGYTDGEIAEAMRNYQAILDSSEHEVKSRYQSFIGFMRGGVEKFVSSANPSEAFKRKTPSWEKPEHGALDDRPDATTPEAIAADNARSAEEAMSPEAFAQGLRDIQAKMRPG